MGGGFGAAARDTFKYSGKVRPGKQSPKRSVPKSISKPDYWKDGQPKARGPMLPWQIQKKSEADIEGMRAAGRIAREVLDLAGAAVAPGVTTEAIDALVHEAAVSRGAYPSPLNYHGFPKSCCTSVNEAGVICHGIPDSSKLRDGAARPTPRRHLSRSSSAAPPPLERLCTASAPPGDIVNIDITCYYGGYHGDCSETFLVGEVDEAGRQLVKVTHDAWQAAIAYCAPGKEYKGIVGAIIEDYIAPHGYSTVREFCGHGAAREASPDGSAGRGAVFHETPNVIHARNNEPGTMQVGHTFTIEPMICEGVEKHILWRDGWTATTKDGKRSAQFEHTLLVTPDGIEALTARTENSTPFWWEK
ncbi:hypothetical protein EMIHUDRAFT_65379 [Emiliania huxleyi CCMP1516]|uniref:Peptidase M24 domain-containing protein n=2 Tax=Emiliania huxleyi TaxID=2903 RepID=A0A0D3JA61_EMIH1|nr:hypothetical protein EMIHUDRAFT_65379 [Emiliania huxleyi CCMP1516]EOD20396.1 hypothetical protein EMIHUDRAFT_65379 [Emiliania huxleyi CCMP1516]|eukprot:XP_005772825.1 hypothetical protein EMIHUDRAFT_65379 [Emiliania huxleyi CCMP1516]